ncbi:hypothetical protein [Geodermatophilus chilensis]|uniref:hypothetical protein n=1 Tax=Geodermatophilus chilensis TaxID=2035835 RepID=UPI0013000019|nr:hypothetical protein [Geodermatophilus chilensis]
MIERAASSRTDCRWPSSAAADAWLCSRFALALTVAIACIRSAVDICSWSSSEPIVTVQVVARVS